MPDDYKVEKIPLLEAPPDNFGDQYAVLVANLDTPAVALDRTIGLNTPCFCNVTACGDPHFLGWSGEYFDYHGEYIYT